MKRTFEFYTDFPFIQKHLAHTEGYNEITEILEPVEGSGRWGSPWTFPIASRN